MKNEELENRLANLKIPEMESSNYQKAFRGYLLNTRRSTLLGILLLILPALFVFSNILEYE